MSAIPPHVLFATCVRAARFFPRAGDGDHHERNRRGAARRCSPIIASCTPAPAASRAERGRRRRRRRVTPSASRLRECDARAPALA